MYSLKGPYPAILCDVCGFEKKVEPIICTIGCIKVFSGPLRCKKAAAPLWSIWPSSGTTHSQVIIWLWTSWSLSNYFEHGKHMCPNEIANAIYRPCFEIWTAMRACSIANAFLNQLTLNSFECTPSHEGAWKIDIMVLEDSPLQSDFLNGVAAV